MVDEGALAPYVVLDCTGDRAWLGGRILADLGADVVKVEPPGGDPGRGRGPFADPAAPTPETNLNWWMHNRGKESVVLDLDDAGDRDRFLAMVAGADALIESYAPGWLDARGLGREVLMAHNPRLVHTTVTPYGSDGPCAGWAACDLTVTAGTGLLWLTGDTDRPPVRVSVPQVFLHAGAEAAVHTLVALWEVQQRGVGQHVDVSAQAAGLRPLMNAAAFHMLEGREPMRAGPYNGRFRMVHSCADGHVAVLAAAGPIGGAMMRFLLDWAARDGVADPLVRDRDFGVINWVNEPPEFFAAVDATMAGLCARHTKAELYGAALEHLLFIAPVTTVADLHTDEQLAARGYFVPVDHRGDGTSLPTPGAWAKLSATPLCVDHRAPRVGEQQARADAPVKAGRVRGSAPVPSPVPAEDARPFAGLKVLDLSWVGVGPMTAGYLAAYGATVVKVESSKRPDVLRLNPPFRDGRPGINNSHFHGDFNPDKLGLGLDLSDPRGREVAWQAIEWADVIVESFTPKALAGWGMDYAAISARHPSMVMLSTCMQGQSGPRRLYRGFGNLMGALAGFYHVTGWPDRDPVMIYGAHTDFLSQRFAACALIAALDHRRRTGVGQHIDVAQYETALQFLGAELLAHAIDGRVEGRHGNRDAERAPHGVFPCVPAPERTQRCGTGSPGDQAWVAIACDDDAQWQHLRSVAQLPDDAAWRTAPGRKADEDRIDALIGAWTAGRTADEVVAALQPRACAAAVLGVPELHTDAQLAHRGFWVPLAHPVYGEVPYSGSAAVLSRTPAEFRAPAPCLGQHSWEVLEGLLGIDPDTIALLLAEGVVEITG